MSDINSEEISNEDLGLTDLPDVELDPRISIQDMNVIPIRHSQNDSLV